MLLLTIPIVILLLPITIWLYIYIYTNDFFISNNIFKIVFFYNRLDRKKRGEQFIEKDLRDELIHLSGISDKKVAQSYDLTLDQAKELKTFAHYISKNPEMPFLDEKIMDIILRSDWLSNLQQTLMLFSTEKTVIAYKRLMKLELKNATIEDVRETFQAFIKLTTNDILVRKALARQLDRLLRDELNPKEKRQFLSTLESAVQVDTKSLLRSLIQANYAKA